ncbi:MAG: hypothetical protein ACYCX4_10325 [Bacillota bacterium]
MPKYQFPKGASVGILYVQIKKGEYYTGVHNGAMWKYDKNKKAYLIKHSGAATAQPGGNYKFTIDTVNFYETREAYDNSNKTGNDYWLIDMWETRPELGNYVNHPGIAFVRSDGRVHNGKFSTFAPLGDLNHPINHYDDIKQKVKSGLLSYWHYNIETLGSGRIRVFSEKVTGVMILDMEKLI